MLVIKSTILPKYVDEILTNNNNIIINPEFLRENFANEDFVNTEIIVFGGEKQIVIDWQISMKNILNVYVRIILIQTLCQPHLQSIQLIHF